MISLEEMFEVGESQLQIYQSLNSKAHELRQMRAKAAWQELSYKVAASLPPPLRDYIIINSIYDAYPTNREWFVLQVPQCLPLYVRVHVHQASLSETYGSNPVVKEDVQIQYFQLREPDTDMVIFEDELERSLANIPTASMALALARKHYNLRMQIKEFEAELKAQPSSKERAVPA